LNRKHVVFGRVVAGYEVVDIVENTKVDKNDRRRWNPLACCASSA
jgi:cyclophilin family peptidyl-prolyl cis-trans isomerase